MIWRVPIAAALLAFAAISTAAADPCLAPRVDIADWPIVRSPRVPGFTLRLPRSFIRDTTTAGSARAARWSDASRARVEITHRLGDSPTPLRSPDGLTAYARCEDRVGSATAVIISYSEGATPESVVVHAHIRWSDGELLEFRADARERGQLDQLLTAVRTVRRAGA